MAGDPGAAVSTVAGEVKMEPAERGRWGDAKKGRHRKGEKGIGTCNSQLKTKNSELKTRNSELKT